ncbi:hypothetical protein ACMFMG_000922 [Clarireedia jacksonii]
MNRDQPPGRPTNGSPNSQLPIIVAFMSIPRKPHSLESPTMTKNASIQYLENKIISHNDDLSILNSGSSRELSPQCLLQVLRSITAKQVIYFVVYQSFQNLYFTRAAPDLCARYVRCAVHHKRRGTELYACQPVLPFTHSTRDE